MKQSPFPPLEHVSSTDFLYRFSARDSGYTPNGLYARCSWTVPRCVAGGAGRRGRGREVEARGRADGAVPHHHAVCFCEPRQLRRKQYELNDYSINQRDHLVAAHEDLCTRKDCSRRFPEGRKVFRHLPSEDSLSRFPFFFKCWFHRR